MKSLLQVIGAFALGMTATQAAAVSYNITAQNSSNGYFSLLEGNTAGEVSSLQSANANQYDADANDGAGGQSVSLLYTGQFYVQGHASDSAPSTNEEFRAFCVQFDQYVVIPALDSGQTAEYDRTTSHFDIGRRNVLATLFYNYFDPNGTPDHQSAFQLAVWKIVHSNIANGAAFDMTAVMDENRFTPGYTNLATDDNGNAIVDGWQTFNGGAVWARAEQFLESLDGDGQDDVAMIDFNNTSLSFLTSDSSQDLIIVPEGFIGTNLELNAVPLPAGGVLLLSGLVTVAAGRAARNRKA